MKSFAQLCRKIDCAKDDNVKIAAMVEYFKSTEDQDKLWAIALFCQKKPARIISTALIKKWAIEHIELPDWLFEESHRIVGDLAETISLLTSDQCLPTTESLSEWIGQSIKLKSKKEEDKKRFVLSAWSTLSKEEVYLINKLLTGCLRIGVSQKLIAKALSKVLDKSESYIAHQLISDWTPMKSSYDQLFVQPTGLEDISNPFPFYQPSTLDQALVSLGPEQDWQVEYKWAGIRTQLIKRNHQLFLWTENHGMLTTSFPEFEILKEAVEDHFVIDGDLVVFSEGTIRPSEAIMKRVKHKNVTKKILFDNPSALVCHDLLEYKGKDLRSKPLRQRRIVLENLLKNISKNTGAPLLLSEKVNFKKWEELSEIRNNSGNLNAIGLTFKHLKGLNHDMPNREEYLIWKAPLFTIEGILLYAQRDQNLRSTLYTEFTFAVRDEQESLVPFTKAHSGLTEDELTEINEFIKKNTLDRFGPVRSVAPIHVFEIAFEGINRSSRHKSGVVLLNPIIKRWQKVKDPDEANTLNDLLDLIS